MKLHPAQTALREYAKPEKKDVLEWFFKTGPGQYGEGDRFIGVVVPQVRAVVKRFRGTPPDDAVKILSSPVNEDRLLALLLWVDSYQRGTPTQRARIAQLYLKHKRRVNNWNLVDASAPYILGEHLHGKDASVLDRLAKSPTLWDRRIAIVSTFYSIRQRDFRKCLEICEALLDDEEDLLHKACGWMLREVGKRNEAVLEQFLRKHGPRMPRTMLRYAIERMPEIKRKRYLAIQPAKRSK
ncbi:MAG: DNA alkylation repair protein [Bacteriovoracia bacterium]